jgi:hypothetical protein
MKFMSSRLAVLAAASAFILAGVAPVNAATVSYSVEFSAYFEADAPHQVISGSFNLTSDSGSGTLNWVSPALWTDLYWNYSSKGDTISVYSYNADNDYWDFLIRDFRSNPIMTSFAYYDGYYYDEDTDLYSSDGIFNSSSRDVTVAPIPLPLPLVLFLSGLGLLGLLGWRKKSDGSDPQLIAGVKA